MFVILVKKTYLCIIFNRNIKIIEMDLKKRIQDDRITAMKAKDAVKKGILITLLGELDRLTVKVGDVMVPVKDPTDADVMGVVKKMVKNNGVIKAEKLKTGKNTDEIDNETEILSIYLPTKMTDEELSNVIKTYVDEHKLDSPKSMGLIMKYLGQNFGGLYDGKTANKLILGFLG